MFKYSVYFAYLFIYNKLYEIWFVKVAAAVPAVKVADCKFNAQQTEKQIVIADGKGIQIIVFRN